MIPTQPILAARDDDRSVSPLSLLDSTLSPCLSSLSLDSSDDEESITSTASDDSDSTAPSSETCCAPCCTTADSRPPITSIEPEHFSPLIIIALYTDLEHARLSWLQREASSTRRRQTVKGRWPARKLVESKTTTLAPAPRAIQVLDSSGDAWMRRWDSYFDGLKIKHLRSPMLFHPSPADVNALVAYASRTGREDELEPIKGVVGREFSKYQRKKRPTRIGRAPLANERERQDYWRPSTPLFHSFIRDDLVDRYDVASLVTHATVTSLSYGPLHVVGEEPQEGFVVRSVRQDGTVEVRGAKAVVMAIGPSSKPFIPPVLRSALPSSPASAGSASGATPWRQDEVCGPGWCHSSAFAIPGCRPLDSELGEKVRRGEKTHVVVVGGGLTSAQIVDSLLSCGVSLVTLVCRSRIKTKHFDFDLSWVSKYANVEKMAFWQEEDPALRFEVIRQARDGGSVNPQFARALQKWTKEGRLEVKTLAEVTETAYDEEQEKWTLELATKNTDPVLDSNPSLATTLSDLDYLVCSTGSKLAIDEVDFLQPILASHPVETVNGLPVLTKDLQWRKDVPLFVMGAYSMLELGPDALNLSGTRAGAERIAHCLGELDIFDSSDAAASDSTTGTQRISRSGRSVSWTKLAAQKRARSAGEGNFFEGLSEAEA
ncbi:Proteophosphoglycan ppg4 [Rhodotorula toruloides ATCC 204091]|uniref:BY PROTMAP: gi/342321412/gb/EGU13346.1/ Proteophosphoglycan ppg4 [Rhodotorula glutinis ATCC 204091] n=1 Tax=Rhodotorula toruloides TaxID=5286 RepID=A0A0K3CAA2_RHOTO|nr:Proteophosphoglycan ppg4 [Rhodotorula toruloides ATCC 204091]